MSQEKQFFNDDEVINNEEELTPNNTTENKEPEEIYNSDTIYFAEDDNSGNNNGNNGDLHEDPQNKKPQKTFYDRRNRWLTKIQARLVDFTSRKCYNILAKNESSNI